MKTLLRSAIFSLALVGSIAAFSSGFSTKNLGLPTAGPKPTGPGCNCVPPPEN